MIKLANLTPYIAIYGAVIATSGLVWDFVKWWKERARLKVVVFSRTKDADEKIQDEMVMIFITNNGSKPTALTHIAFRCYSNFFMRLIKMDACKSNFVTKSAFAYPDYHNLYLEQNKQWQGIICLTKKLKEWAGSNIVVLEVAHSGSKRSIKVKIDLDDRIKYTSFIQLG